MWTGMARELVEPIFGDFFFPSLLNQVLALYLIFNIQFVFVCLSFNGSQWYVIRRCGRQKYAIYPVLSFLL